MTASMIYVTCASEAEAGRIGRTLVEERLAACANIIPSMRSLYWWEGAVQQGNEVVLIAKTQAEQVAPLTARVKALHSYDVPCVVALPLVAGNPDYFAWIAAETRLRSAMDDSERSPACAAYS